MGGYGAFKLAFRYPGRFAAAASLSGALIDFSQAPVESPDPDLTAELENIFGDLSEFSGSHHDLYALSRRLARNKRENAPLLFQCCGTEDHLYQDNLRFKAHIEQLGLSLTYREGPGEHEWGYWDHMIQEVLTWLPLKSAAS